jgi:uncharacterized protein YbjT (DUF2867 family)
MNVVIVGATGMVGQAALRESLIDNGVERVATLGRRATGKRHAKLREIVHDDLMNLTAVESELSGFDACFYCLGVASTGMTEESYTRVTYDLTVSVATTLARLNPAMTFIFVSGRSTDSSERGRMMWARVKGRAENAVLRMPFRAAYMFRPAFILPMHGIRSRTRAYRIFYTLLTPFNSIVKALFPGSVTTTEQLGRAMLTVARRGYPKPILESGDIASV